MNKHIYNSGKESKGKKLRVEIIIDDDPDASTKDILVMLNYGGLHNLNSRYEINIEPYSAPVVPTAQEIKDNPCTECEGKKELTFYRGDDEYVFPCPHCGGTGVDPNEPEEG